MRILVLCLCLIALAVSGCRRGGGCQPGMFFEDKECQGENCPIDHNGQNK